MKRFPTLKEVREQAGPLGLLDPSLRQSAGKGNFSNVLSNGRGVARRGRLTAGNKVAYKGLRLKTGRRRRK